MKKVFLIPLFFGLCLSVYCRPAQSFNFENVVARAAELAQKPFQAPQTIPDFLNSLDYDHWRDIRFKPQEALWSKEHLYFNVQFFHTGFLYNYPVAVNVIDNNKAQPVKFDPNLFDYGKTGLKDKIPKDLGFAGFRIHYPINRSSYKDEFAVFLGASYFRAVAKGENYGLSARGIAVNTGLPGGEEFPFFKEFWIVKPYFGAKQIIIYALLDAKSLTGAYEFVIKPGSETIMDVKAQVFPRTGVERLGIAPLTSMYFYSENRGECVDDYRPRVHDSDGLSVALNSGEWLWRPLVNPRQIFVNVFQAKKLTGFGLIQRDQDFNDYQDLEANFESRPSTWVAPRGDWGPGSIFLIQLPTPNEKNDNIVAFWVAGKDSPQGGPAKNKQFSYTLKWCPADRLLPALGYVTSTRYMHESDNRIKFVIDFQGKNIASLTPDTKLQAAISMPDDYQLENPVIEKNEITEGWRLVFEMKLPPVPKIEKILPEKTEAVELRAALQKDGKPLTETWTFALEL